MPRQPRFPLRIALIVLVALTLPLALAAAGKTLVVKADQERQRYVPVWVEKGATITFSVSGAWSAWHPEWKPCGPEGHTYFKKMGGYHLGTLLASVEGGPTFAVTDGLEYTSPVAGYLALWPNREGYKHLKANGSLSVTVEGFVVKDLSETMDAAALRALADYKRDYVGSDIKSLGWTGSIAEDDPGTLPASVLAKALRRVNYFRKMTGLYPVTFDAAKNRQAQAAALIMLANKKLSHYPPRTWRCWSQDGANGAKSSNLGLPPLKSIIAEFIDDFGASNAVCGHRRWLLSSTAGTFGFGAAYDPGHWTFGAEALHVTSGAAAPAGFKLPEFVAWPPAGYVPAPVFYARGTFCLARAGAGVDFSAATVSMRDAAGKAIPVKVTRFTAYNDPGIAWDILPAEGKIDDFRGRHAGRAITVRIGNVIVDGAAKTYTYKTTIITP